ncbi:MAG: sensor histidine kinase [Clostridia bacterium]|nr:sensor histidine kinase [Clostridia bacterium]MBO5435816.1 sensor histidine kinase [bacterium]
MDSLKYIVEDSTIAYLLGVNNFTNAESAILELIKNAYDANALNVNVKFSEGSIIISDDGLGMDSEDIHNNWMHVGKSKKDYEIVDVNNKKRILAGSKGVGRFALARLGEFVKVYSKKSNCRGILWETNWNNSSLIFTEDINKIGTKIIISQLREKWGKKKVEDLIKFLSKTYNDNVMKIRIIHPDFTCDVPEFFPNPQVGKNCLSSISLHYDKKMQKLETVICSDEFLDEAMKYCSNVNLKYASFESFIVNELDASEWDLSDSELEEYLNKLGDFTAQFYFNVKQSSLDMEKFLYKHTGVPEAFSGGVVLYRNAFSITTYEGKNDWLGFGKRSRKSPAAASHPTGAWRVRENQLSGQVYIDKKENKYLVDLSNRQGLEDNIYFQLFVKIIIVGINEFERYRQGIIRNINVKNDTNNNQVKMQVVDKIVAKPQVIFELTKQEAEQLANEIKSYQKENLQAKQNKDDVEERYKYDIRILNVLATLGLKASAIAHEMRNDRNVVANNTERIIDALKTYGMWDELTSPSKTKRIYNNVPYLLETNNNISSKLVAFMNVMLTNVEKKKFKPAVQSIYDTLQKIKITWESDYAWININIKGSTSTFFNISEDVLQVVFDNLILNSIQQNENKSHLEIFISVEQLAGVLSFVYSDNGNGLNKKYESNPRKILEVHETTRSNGHGLGMWIVNNTINMTGGSVDSIGGTGGFFMEFTIGGAL